MKGSVRTLAAFAALTSLILFAVSVCSFSCSAEITGIVPAFSDGSSSDFGAFLAFIIGDIIFLALIILVVIILVRNKKKMEKKIEEQKTQPKVAQKVRVRVETEEPVISKSDEESDKKQN